MRMQKEEKIVVVLLLMALGSLAVAFWAFSPEDDLAGSTSDSTAQKQSTLSVEGVVLEIKPTKSGGNLLLKLDATPLPIFIPAGSGAEEVQNKVHSGDRVKIKGTVSEFQGSEEIKVERARDVELAN
ncbi:MAG: hypothetical protein LUO89_05465 [Methanothrix sp.]|nr:hypothetical protein [Methanothrix sp.]